MAEKISGPHDRQFKVGERADESFLFGLDPLLRTFVRMFASDVRELSAQSAFPGGFALASHQVTKAVIMGHVVGAAIKTGRRQSFAKYTIDDGTGLITCILWEGKTGTKAAQQSSAVRRGGEKAGKFKDAFSGDFQGAALFHSNDGVCTTFGEAVSGQSRRRSRLGYVVEEGTCCNWHTLYPLGALVEVRGTVKAFSPMCVPNVLPIVRAFED